MRITRNRFRLKLGLAMIALGIVPLFAVDWAYMRERMQSPLQTWLHTTRWEARRKSAPLSFSGMFFCVGIILCLEFKGDPPPRKDPWEE